MILRRSRRLLTASGRASPSGAGRYATPDEISIDGPLTGYCPGGASDTPDPAARETEIGWLIFRAGSAG